MGIAYFILAHKNPAQITRLLRALAYPDNCFFLHYERRAPRAEHEALARLAEEFPRFHVLPPQPVMWGRFSNVSLQLEAIRRALELEDRWTHFIPLSGQDFPLYPQAAIVADLQAAPDASFLSCFDPFTEPHWKNLQDRLDRFYFESPALESFLKTPFLGRRIRRLLGWTNRLPFVPWVRRSLPAGFHYRGGANHVILARAAAAYIVGDPQADRIIRWLRYSLHPEESLFQSVLFNSPHAGSMVNDDRRAILWERPGAPSPVTFTMAHLPWLRAQREAGKLFARKFDAAVDDAILGALEKDLGL